MMMDNSELLQLKQQATVALIKYVDDEELYRLAQALETAVEGSEDFDAMVDKVTALEEENDMLRSRCRKHERHSPRSSGDYQTGR